MAENTQVKGFGHAIRTRNLQALTDVLNLGHVIQFDRFELALCSVCSAVLHPGADDMTHKICARCSEKGGHYGA